jgi:hypothetical protein
MTIDKPNPALEKCVSSAQTSIHYVFPERAVAHNAIKKKGEKQEEGFTRNVTRLTQSTISFLLNATLVIFSLLLSDNSITTDCAEVQRGTHW